MAQARSNISTLDPVWETITAEARDIIVAEPTMAPLVYSVILTHSSLQCALSHRMAHKLASGEMTESILHDAFDQAYAADCGLGAIGRADLLATFERDPACHRMIQPLLYYKGFQAVQAYRMAHWLWAQGRHDFAYFIQMRASEVFGVDIHPAAKIGQGLMIDHAHSIVIGETAVVGNNVSMLHAVTLGGTGKDEKDRHPKIGDDVLLGAGAKVLGNISIGCCSRVAAGSVVLKDVPPGKTVAGVPAKVVGDAGCKQPAKDMDQLI